MQIHLPKRQTRDVPPIEEIREVMGEFCTKTGLISDGLTIVVTGGDWDHRIKKLGVRIVSFKEEKNPLSIHVLIGCKSNSVRAYITYRESDSGVRAGILYRRLARFFKAPNDKFVCLEKAAPDKDKDPIENPPTDTETTPPAKIEGLASDGGLDDGGPDSPPPDAPVKTDVVASNGSVDSSHPINYKLFFGDESNMHLAVVALVGRFEVTSKLFGFREFAEVLRDEVKIDLEDNKMASMVGRFTRSEYIVRYNPGKIPTRYQITQKAIDYAAKISFPIENKPRGEKEQKPVKTPAAPAPETSAASVAKEHTSFDGLATKLAGLKTAESNYQRVKAEIDRRSQTLSSFNLAELAKESARNDAEIATLEAQLQRLQKLKERKGQIQHVGENAACLQKEILAFQEELKTGNLERKHEEFTAAKKQAKDLISLFEDDKP